ncbi:hypothetical protein CR513_30130, partial [Mucuna pruriens]
MTNPNRKDWSQLLKDALWAHRTAYRTPLGMSPYRIVFGKTCHLHVELEHKAYYDVKQCNLAYDQAGEQRKFQLQELNELRLEAYENSRIYKPSSRPKSVAIQFMTKAHSRWDGPFVITNIFPYGAVQLKDEQSNNTFQVNGHQIKPFYEGSAPIASDMEIISLIRKIRNIVVSNSNSSNCFSSSDNSSLVTNNSDSFEYISTNDFAESWPHQIWCTNRGAPISIARSSSGIELKSSLIHLLPKFHGLVGEDPHKHLKEFHVVYSTIRLQGIPKDYIKTKAFPFSLDGAA